MAMGPPTTGPRTLPPRMVVRGSPVGKHWSRARRVVGLALSRRARSRAGSPAERTDAATGADRCPLADHSRTTPPPPPPPRRHALAVRPTVRLGPRACTHRRSRSREFVSVPTSYRVRLPAVVVIARPRTPSSHVRDRHRPARPSVVSTRSRRVRWPTAENATISRRAGRAFSAYAVHEVSKLNPGCEFSRVTVFDCTRCVRESSAGHRDWGTVQKSSIRQCRSTRFLVRSPS